MSTVAVSRGIYTTEYPVIVKYFSKSETPVDANYMMLRAEDMYTILRNISSASVPFRVVQTDKIIALVQNYVACSLYNRISTRPFFSSLEKRWITFLLCSAVADIHRAGVPSFLNSRIILYLDRSWKFKNGKYLVDQLELDLFIRFWCFSTNTNTTRRSNRIFSLF